MNSAGALMSVRLVLAVAGAALIGGLGLAAPVAAHVSVDPAEATRDGDARVALRVPSERDNASTVKLTVVLPDRHAMTSVRTPSAPGWSAAVDKRKLDPPAEELTLKKPSSYADQPAAASVTAMSPGRVGAIVAAVLGLIGVVIGGLALARPAGRFGTGNGRLGAIVAGLIGMALGALIVATSAGGIGTGNGLGGAIVAMMLGLIAMVLGGLAMTRRRGPGCRQ